MTIKPAAIVGQVVLYGAFAAFIGYFATNPRYQHIPPDHGLIKLSLSHFGGRECRQRTPEELEKLPRNMRNPQDCPRERSVITLELDIDGKPFLREVLRPTGIAKDGITSIYRRFEVNAGEHRIAVRMNDDISKKGFQHVKEETIVLKPAHALVIDFNPDKGGLFIQ
jgi:hypothetical protein